ncbi:MAG: Fe(2+)-trafficking protein, partial [Chloroflexota bacterium]|nr:Fe(2+)-trafficking protein [Chloroflexota bacterium]
MAQVTCARCGQTGEQLPRPPLGGTRGQVIQARTCAACWSEWLQTSANLINHYGLQVAVPADRQQLYVVMA